MKKKKGFTLIEMIAVIAIIGITGALVFTLFGKTHKVFSMAEKESVSVDEARNVLSIVGEDIMMSTTVEINDDKVNISRGTDVFIYSLIDSKIIKYKGDEKIATLAYKIKIFEVVPLEESDPPPVGRELKSYKITIMDNSDMEYQTIVTRRK